MPAVNLHSNLNNLIFILCLLLLIISHGHLAIPNRYPDSSVLTNPDQIRPATSGGAFVGGKTGECITTSEEDVSTVADELEMESEITRRLLMMQQQQQRRYISYDTLRRDTVPCTAPGASYYSCGGGGGGATAANRYHRGCQVITKCSRNYGA